MERNAVVAAMPRARRVFRNIPSGTLRLLPSGGRKLTSLLPIKRVTSVVAAFSNNYSGFHYSSISKESEGCLSCDGLCCRFLDLVLGPEDPRGLGWGGFALKIFPFSGVSHLERAHSWHAEMDGGSRSKMLWA